MRFATGVSRNFLTFREQLPCRIPVIISFSNLWSVQKKFISLSFKRFSLSQGRKNVFLATFFRPFVLSYPFVQSKFGWIFCENNQKWLWILIKVSGKGQNWKYNKLKIQKSLHTQYICWSRNNYAPVNIDEKQEWLWWPRWTIGKTLSIRLGHKWS